ncbi:MAG: HAMP domain-containing protein [Clostridiales bacterium]|jgi:signal transduction histidine kinase|nr:HAMP domain-containing protein [Clostridiales bacterium]
MKKDIFKTLFSRMLFTYLTVILCLLLLMGITVSSMFSRQYIQEEEKILRSESEKINTTLKEKYIYADKRRAARQELESTARKYDGLIQVIDQEGNLLSLYNDVESEEKWGDIAEIYRIENTPGVHVSIANIEIWPESGQGTFLVTGGIGVWLLSRNGQKLSEEGMIVQNLFSSYTGMPTISIIRGFYNAGRLEGAILMHLDMSTINMAISQVYKWVLLIALIAIAAAVLAVYYLTTRITRPITDMNSAVRRYSMGAFNLRLDDSGADEVAQLAKSFNVMADGLNSLEQTRRSFVANVSHELRSPLTSISGFLEAIQDGTIPKKKQGAYLGIVISETKRMTTMVNNLLDLARIESGQIDMRPTVFDINELARRVIVTFEARVNTKNMDVRLNLVKPNCFVEADFDQIGQVMRNLIDNAVKYSPENAPLEIHTECLDKKTARVSVIDHGCGIPQADLRHIFDRFYKAEKAHTPSAQSGTGLGLSIAKVIIGQHGQEIFAKSVIGEGTTFCFTLKRSSDTRKRTEKNEETGNAQDK